jgi:hypothetical protein
MVRGIWRNDLSKQHMWSTSTQDKWLIRRVVGILLSFLCKTIYKERNIRKPRGLFGKQLGTGKRVVLLM